MKTFANPLSAIVGALALGIQSIGAVPLLGDFTASLTLGDAVASQADLGPIHILFQNDLSNNASTGALLLPRPTISTSAEHICSSLDEKLFPLDQSLKGGIGSDLVDQFNYLRFVGTIDHQDAFWIDGGGGAGNVAAYRVSRGSIRPYGQGEKLGVLCTHTAPPTVVSRSNSYANGEASTLGVVKRVSVQTGEYTVTGYRDRRSFRFLGIPFGDAPVGSKRFMHATPYTGNMVVDATNYRNACVQKTTLQGPSPMGEDCLNLNVYTPMLGSSGKKALKPVLVAIYGGGFVNGRNSVHEFDGGNLASRSDIVVVMINYRLGALGWLASDDDVPGNGGLSDQILALKWAKKHIAAFGGDPDRITIGGESAGAQSVSALIASSEAKGLFHAAFMMSNPWVPWVKRSVQTNHITPAVAASLNCPTKGHAMVECLQKIEDPLLFVQGDAFTNATSEIAKALDKVVDSTFALGSIEPFLPTPDGLLDGQFFYLAGNGTIPNNVPILLGTTSGEGTSFTYPMMSGLIPNTQAALNKAFSSLYPSDFIPQLESSGYFDLNSSNPDSVRETIAYAFTYNFFTCPTQRIVNMAQEAGQFPKVYLYETQSGYPSSDDLPAKCTPEGTGIEVCHSDDISSAFGSLNFEEGIEVSEQYLQFVRYNADAFSAFVRSHSPNPDDGYLKARGRSYEYTREVQMEHPWQPFTKPVLETRENKTQILSAPNGIRYGPVPHKDVCDFFVEHGKLTHQELNNGM